MVAAITERVDDIFNAPSSSVLVHACNCRGAWGAGVAKEFKKRFPAAFNTYKDYCKSRDPEDIVGTTLLIKQSTHWVACLFTSRDFGKRVDPIDLVLAQTERSVIDLKRQIEGLKKESPHQLGGIWSVRVNVGYFGVPWARTLEVLKRCELDMTVVRREEDDVALEEGEIAGEVNKLKKTKSASSLDGPKSVEKKSATSTKSTEAKANESKKLSESKPAQTTKKPAKAPTKTKARAPPKGIPVTDRVLRTRKAKPKPVEVAHAPALKKVVKKPKAPPKATTKTPTKATTKKATKATAKSATKDKGPSKKKAATKPKEKRESADAVAQPSPEKRSQEREQQKRKRETASTPSSKRAKK